MRVTKEKSGEILTMTLEGRLDTTTAEILHEEIAGIESDVRGIIFDMDQLVVG